MSWVNEAQPSGLPCHDGGKAWLVDKHQISRPNSVAAALCCTLNISHAYCIDDPPGRQVVPVQNHPWLTAVDITMRNFGWTTTDGPWTPEYVISSLFISNNRIKDNILVQNKPRLGAKGGFDIVFSPLA
jgi:hypothetical protein